MIRDKFDLSGKVAIITGSGTGLGQAMALALAEAGADIVTSGRRPEPLQETKALVEAKGSRCLAVPTDVTKSEQVNAMVAKAIDAFGRIDILINNAGGALAGRGKTLTEITDEEWHEGIDTNLTSAFFCSRAVVPHMLERGWGRIINVSSLQGFRGMRHNFMYPVAKGGVVQLTKALAMTYARDNIRCTCIVPGWFPLRQSEEERRQIATFQPTGTAGEREQIGTLAVFLCSDASDYISGETVVLDGGLLAATVTPAGVVPLARG